MGGAGRYLAILLLLVPAPGGAELSFGGHLKPQLVFTTYPEDSLFHDLFGSDSTDLNLATRLTLSFDTGPWDVRVDYQLIGLQGDTIEVSREFPPALQLLFARLPEDDRRLFDLTRVLSDEGRFAALHRLDRLSVGYTGDRGTLRLGRQAVSWGNGLVYNPMDIFNPFDPAAVDKEYKAGDDMLYGQLARHNGDDLQGVVVFRRSLLTGDFEAEESSIALKYHGLAGAGEYDLLAASHFDDPLLGLGGNRALGGAVWSGDLVVTFAEEETVASLVTGIAYSWSWGGKNVSGVLEYFYNGFGQPGGEYSTAELAANPELLERFARGELFTLGRHYLAASALIEVTPLFLLTPTLFSNLADPSALLQLVSQNDLRENLLLLGAVNLPFGADGTEFGGLESDLPGRYLSSGPSLFLQLAWYF